MFWYKSLGSWQKPCGIDNSILIFGIWTKLPSIPQQIHNETRVLNLTVWLLNACIEAWQRTLWKYTPNTELMCKKLCVAVVLLRLVGFKKGNRTFSTIHEPREWPIWRATDDLVFLTYTRRGGQWRRKMLEKKACSLRSLALCHAHNEHQTGITLPCHAISSLKDTSIFLAL